MKMFSILFLLTNHQLAAAAIKPLHEIIPYCRKYIISPTYSDGNIRSSINNHLDGIAYGWEKGKRCVAREGYYDDYDKP